MAAKKINTKVPKFNGQKLASALRALDKDHWATPDLDIMPVREEGAYVSASHFRFELRAVHPNARFLHTGPSFRVVINPGHIEFSQLVGDACLESSRHNGPITPSEIHDLVLNEFDEFFSQLIPQEPFIRADEVEM